MGEAQDNLVEVGRLLFGARWQSDLARVLGTSDRMVRYWTSGTHARPADLPLRLCMLLEGRVERMREMIALLEGPTELDEALTTNSADVPHPDRPSSPLGSGR